MICDVSLQDYEVWICLTNGWRLPYCEAREDDISSDMGRTPKTASIIHKATIIQSSRHSEHFLQCLLAIHSNAGVRRALLLTYGGKHRHGNEAPAASKSVRPERDCLLACG